MSRPKHPRVLNTLPPEAWRPLGRLARAAQQPLRRFLEIEAASGVLLLVAAAFAIACANSGWAEGYRAFWHTPIAIRIGDWELERSLEWIVNDGLMAIFFFVVGLEIRREIHAGELSEWKRAALPAAAALGGMLVPALLYLALARSAEARPGWGVPMATDIAFAVGVLALLGRRVPPALRVLLLALAVIDDLGAILVIALFYSEGVSATGLLIAAAGLACVLIERAAGVRSKLAYVPAGIVVWAGIYAAGIHPTIAGVVLGLVTPVRAWLGLEGFIEGVREELTHLDDSGAEMPNQEVAAHLQHFASAGREALSPAEHLIETLHPWVAFGIMPLFAAANAGVTLGELSAKGVPSSVTIAVLLALVAGKPIGVLLSCWLTLSLGVARLPVGITWRHLVVLGSVAGIGFTMSLFIAQLAFADAELLGAAKVGVLGASAAAAVLALVLGRLTLPPHYAPGAARTEDDAERSTLS